MPDSHASIICHLLTEHFKALDDLYQLAIANAKEKRRGNVRNSLLRALYLEAFADGMEAAQMMKPADYNNFLKGA